VPTQRGSPPAVAARGTADEIGEVWYVLHGR
jgi:hypothetical protein